MIELVFDGADVVNTIFYLVEGDYANAALSGVSCVPLFGSAVGKGAKYVSKAADLSKLGRSVSKISKVDNIRLFLKVRKIDVEDMGKWLGKWGDDLAYHLKGNPYLEYVTPEGLIYRVPVNRELELAMEVTDEFGDTVRFSRRVGEGSEDAGKALV